MKKDKKSANQHEDLKEKRKRMIKVSVNDGMNTTVPGSPATSVVAMNEATLFKQAENPLGDPNKN
jgi:hypothetical protein